MKKLLVLLYIVLLGSCAKKEALKKPQDTQTFLFKVTELEPANVTYERIAMQDPQDFDDEAEF